MKANKYDLIISVTPKSGLLSAIASFLTYNNKKFIFLLVKFGQIKIKYLKIFNFI